MAEQVLVKAAPDTMSMGSLVMVVSQDGTICSVLERPDDHTGDTDLTDSSIDALWSGELADKIKSHIKRVLRSRQFQSMEAEDVETGRIYEFMAVVHGRDRVLLIVRDISERTLNLSKIKQLAYTDEITTLPNREYLLSELQKITDMQRLKEGRAAMICINVSHFDDHGHALHADQQDDVLRVLASRLPSQLRRINDATEPDAERYSIVARTDFRQFGIVLPSIEGGEDAEAVIARVISKLKQPVAVGSRAVTIRAHGGVALFPQDGDDPATLFRNAVAAMEDARNSHSIPFKLHSGTVRLRALQRQDLELELRSALERDEYALNFLPIVKAQSGAPTTLEALLRWPDKVLGSQTTREIVAIAERTGLIVPIGDWVLRHACEQLCRWHKNGYEDVRLAVNVSTQEFSRSDLVHRIEAILSETGVDAAQLDLEIRENILFRDALRDYATCLDLKALGVGIVVDDYGTGACSLAHLAQSPIDAIKIDNMFVANIETSERDRAACTAAAALADRLGIKVIAEGVETKAQAEFLQEHGCDLLQGFLFCEPLPDAEALDYLGSFVVDR